MGIVRDLYYARKMSAGLKLPAPTVALMIKRLRLAAAMGGGSIEKTVSGAMVHITDALAKAALSVLVNITPIQDLHGYANPWPAGGGKNILPDISRNSSGYNVSVSFVGNTATLTGLANSSGGRNVFRSEYFSLAAGTYYFKKFNESTVKPSVYLQNGTSIVSADADGMFTLSADSTQMNIGLNVISGTDYNYTGTFLISRENVSVYSPYSNICPISGLTGLSVYVSSTQDPDDATVYAVDWTTPAGTVYGGTLDVVSGELTVDMVNIPSYNGETINEPWLSSIDAYAAGTTPTIGAQVVYTLATPLTYQLTPQEIQMLLGENYVWSSSGDTVSVTYIAEGNANNRQALNILLGGNYSNPKTADDVSDKEALEIILGGNK